MAVFTSFSDESQTDNENKDFIYAGYVGCEKDWPGFAQAWQERVLDSHPKIPYFHMTDLRSPRWRRDHGLTRLQADAKIGEAIAVVASTGGLTSVTAVIPRKELEIVLKECKRKGLEVGKGVDQPDYLGFITFSWGVLGHLHQNHPDVEKVDFVVARKKTVSHYIEQYHKSVKQHIGSFESLVGELLIVSSEDRNPLQAADLWCWHVQRHASERLDETDSKNLDRLLQTPHRDISFSKTEMSTLSNNLTGTEKDES